MKHLPLFITGNQSKADYLSRQLGMTINHRGLELEELQSIDLHTIVAHKLRQAYDSCHIPVLVEDVSLEFEALGGLPGPYIKWFITAAGDEACCTMLDGFNTRNATIRCCYGYYDGTAMKFFDSELHGSIADSPRGDNGFGFDRIFVHQDQSITRAEMSQSENERTYANEMKPFRQVRDFLQSL